MSSFPPQSWEVRHLADMDKLTGSPQDNSQYYMQALLAVSPSAGLEGSFRFLVSGNEHLSMSVPVSSIIDHELFAGLTIELQLQLGEQIIIDKNSSVSGSVDIVDLARSQDLEVYNKEGEAATEVFLEAMDTYKKTFPDKKNR